MQKHLTHEYFMHENFHQIQDSIAYCLITKCLVVDYIAIL